MVKPSALLGAMVEEGVKPSSRKRVDHSLSDLSQPGSVLGDLFSSLTGTPAAAAPSSSAPGGLSSLKDLAAAFLGDSKNLKTAGIGALAGALLGGQGKAMKGAVGGGALALLGTLALQALRSASQTPAEAGSLSRLDPGARLAAGLSAPASAEEEKQLESVAELIVRAMINAAKADGKIDEAEIKRIVGHVGADGLSAEERDFLTQELRKPLDIDSVTRAVPNAQVAAQVYAASLMAVELDTPAEKNYLEELARRLKLPPQVVAYLHRAVGVA